MLLYVYTHLHIHIHIHIYIYIYINKYIEFSYKLNNNNSIKDINEKLYDSFFKNALFFKDIVSRYLLSRSFKTISIESILGIISNY